MIFGTHLALDNSDHVLDGGPNPPTEGGFTKRTTSCVMHNGGFTKRTASRSGRPSSAVAELLLSCVIILTRDIDIANLSVCSSVRNVPVSDENGLTYRHSFFLPYGSPIILVLPALNIFTKFRRGHPLRGAKYR